MIQQKYGKKNLQLLLTLRFLSIGNAVFKYVKKKGPANR